MNRNSTCLVFSTAIAVFSASLASATTTLITQWNFNSGLSPSYGVGSAVTTVGQGTNAPLGPSGGGSPNDPAYPNLTNIYLGWNGSQPGDTSGLNRIRFMTSTVGQTALTFSWSQQIGYRASRYYQLRVTTDGGTTWNSVSGGLGTPVPIVLGQGTASAVVDNSGLVTIVMKDNANANLSGGQTGITAAKSTANFNVGLSYLLPAGAWENNAGFGMELTPIHNPYQSNPAAADYGYVGSFSGLNSTDTSIGYIRSAGSGGGQRLDVVTLSVPEPTTLAVGLGAIGFIARRRK